MYMRIVWGKILPGKWDEFEAIFDAEQHLPVTVRYNWVDSKGKADSIMWTCVWQAGGKFEEKEFKVPDTAPARLAKEPVTV